MADLTGLDHQVHLRVLATALERVCNANIDMRSSSPTVFDAVSVPAMSVHCYLVRMHRYTKFDFVCFHVATWYLHRLGQIDPAYCPTLHNIHRLLVAALLVASKATDDIFHANLFMAQCGGIGVTELNKLEVELCERLQWRLLPTVQDMRELLEALQSPTASFWDAWRNGPRFQAPPPAIAASAEPAAEPRHSNEQQQQQQRESHAQGVSGRLPHAKSVQHSLARLFSSGVNTGSDGNLEGLAAASATAAKLATTTQGKLQPGQVVEGAGSPSSGSPRSVIGGRAFSLSNLFGLASGW